MNVQSSWGGLDYYPTTQNCSLKLFKSCRFYIFTILCALLHQKPSNYTANRYVSNQYIFCSHLLNTLPRLHFKTFFFKTVNSFKCKTTSNTTVLYRKYSSNSSRPLASSSYIIINDI